MHSDASNVPVEATQASTAGLTVLVLACDRPVWLKRALESLVEQTYGDINVVVTDDSTTSESQAVSDAFHDQRLTWTKGPRRGQLQNLLHGFECLNTEFFTILHDDDWLAPDTLARLMAPMLEDSTVDISCAAISEVDDTDRVLADLTNTRARARELFGLRPGLTRLSAKETRRALVIGQIVSPFLGTIFRTATFPKSIPLETGPLADYWILATFAKNPINVYYDPDALAYYRLHGDPAMRHGLEVSTLQQIVNPLLLDPYFEDVHSELRAKLFQYEFRSILKSIHHGLPHETRRLLTTVSNDMPSRYRLLARALALPGANSVAKRILRKRWSRPDT